MDMVLFQPARCIYIAFEKVILIVVYKVRCF